MAITKAELQQKLSDTLTAVTNARPGVDSAVALVHSLRQELADAIAASADMTEAAAAVDQIMATHEANAKALADGLVAPGTQSVPPTV